MCKYIIYTYISFLLCSVLVSCEEKLVVDTTHGKISGTTLRTLYNDVEYAAFMGIPYAAPPVKELRFQPPQSIAAWTNILTTTNEKQPCPQLTNHDKNGQIFGFVGIEDCLYLDIFTPAVDDAKRAVILFIYNEHFTNSYKKSQTYQPDFFIEEDVIIVTISHRLSALGFLSLEDETLWGNAGLKDIVRGLEWVKDNIEKFGGDSSRITLMGSQGGATAVDLLIHSKKKDLFRSAILQSGSSWASAYLQNNVRERAFELAKLLNKKSTTSADVIKDLINSSAVNITVNGLETVSEDYFKQTQRSVLTFAPIVEKDSEGLIVDYPENSTRIETPILMGFNSREGIRASLNYLIDPRTLEYLKEDSHLQLPLRVNFHFDPDHEAFNDAVKEINKFYFPNGISAKKVADYVTYIGDALTSYSIDYAARFYAKISTSSLYYYHFDYYSNLNQNKNNLIKLSTVEYGTWGAATGDELCYLFKCPALKEQYLKHDIEKSEERSVQKKLVKLWSNFAKYGNPTPEGDSTLSIKWPTFTLKEKNYLNIDKKMEVKKDLNKKRFQFWDTFIKKWEKSAFNGVITKKVKKKHEL